MDFTHRAGPLPVWGWLVAGGGALIVAYVTYRNRAKTAATSAATSAASTGATDAMAGIPATIGGFDNTVGATVTQPPAPSPQLSDFSVAQRHGQGYIMGKWGDLNATPVVATSGTYNTITQAQGDALQASGKPLFFMSAPGVFTQVQGDWRKSINADTALYQRLTGGGAAGDATTMQGQGSSLYGNPDSVSVLLAGFAAGLGAPAIAGGHM